MTKKKQSSIKKALVLSSVVLLTAPSIVSAQEGLQSRDQENHSVDSVKKETETSQQSTSTPDVANVSEALNQPENRVSIGTGYRNTINELTNRDGVVHFKTESKAVISMGIGSQTKTTIKIDREIAKPFFSTPNFIMYISGSVDRLGRLGIGNSSITLQQLMTKGTNLTSLDKAYYDFEEEEFIILSPKYVAAATQYQNVDMYLDLERWSEDSGRLVERKPGYTFNVKSNAKDLALNLPWGSAQTILYGVEDVDSWIENPVDPTTLTTEDDIIFSGNGKQNMENRHQADMSVELTAGSRVLSKSIPMDAEGNWSYNANQSFKDGVVMKARVVAKEGADNHNEIADTNYSKMTYYTIGASSTSWEDWVVKAPSISTSYDGETIITGSTPSQNRQNGRSYTLIVLLDGKTVYKKEDLESGLYSAPLFNKNLVKGEKIQAYIVGNEPGQKQKLSKEASEIVLENQDDQADWDRWVVNAPELEKPQLGDMEIEGFVPAQNKFNGRNYDVAVSLNGKEVGKENFTFEGGEFRVFLDQALAANDVITATVIGHEKDEQDKSSQTVEEVVSDPTNWEAWTVKEPTINDLMEGNTQVTGELPAQDDQFDRTYTLETYVNDKKVDSKEIEALASDYTVDLKDKLVKDDSVKVVVIGHQKDRDDKTSKDVTTVVKADPTNWEAWTVKEPTINDLMEGNTQVTGNLPAQDDQFDRTYTLETYVNGDKVDSKKVEASASDYTVDLKDKLSTDDTVKVVVIGHQKDRDDKASKDVTTVVKADPTNWEAWTVKEPTINDLMEGNTQVTGELPAQDAQFDRTYTLETYVNDKKVDSKEVKASSGDYTVDLKDKLVKDDSVKVVVIGHQKDRDDKASKDVTTVVKADPTNWEAWTVKEPTISDLMEGNTQVTGNLPVQDDQFDRTYTLETYVNDKKVDSKKVEASASDYTVDLKDKLSTDDTVKVVVIGHQKDRDDKTSKDVTTVVKADPTNWEAWTVKEPTINDLMEGNTQVTGNLPAQDDQFDRTYTLETYVNGDKVDSKKVEASASDYTVDLKDKLSTDDTVKVVVIGHQKDRDDKASKDVTTVVKADPTNWEAWTVKEPTINDLMEGNTQVTGELPAQDAQFDRTYTLETYVNDKKVDSKKVEASASDYTVDLKDKLSTDDTVKVVVIGHQKDRDDKTSKDVTTVVKADPTNWESWTVKEPTINDLMEGNTQVTGNLPAQDAQFARTYTLETYVNGDKVDSKKVEASSGDYTVDLKDKLVKDDTVKVVVIGHQKDRDDKASKDVTTVVKADPTNWEAWTVKEPTINDLMEGNTQVTGNLPAQDAQFDRTYILETYVNDVKIDSKEIEASSGEYTVDLTDKLSTDDTVKVVVIGHQKDYADKASKEVTTVVQGDPTNWNSWLVTAPTIDEVFAGDTSVHGSTSELNTEFSRQYQIELSVNGTVMAQQAITANGPYEVKLDSPLKENDVITAKVIGSQSDRLDKESEITERKVEKIISNTTSEFEIGYWQSYGLVYEGQINNDSWDLSSSGNVVKEVRISDKNGTVVNKKKAVNTDWYEKGKFNGYQLILDNELLGSLELGLYTLSMAVSINGEQVAEEPLTLKPVNARMGVFHDDYAELENVVIKANLVSPVVINNMPGIKIDHYADSSRVKIVNKYWDNSTELVFDGYFEAIARIEKGSNKQLVVKSKAGETVYTKDHLQAFETSWGQEVDIPIQNEFQAIVPAEFTNQDEYTYELNVLDTDGRILISAPLV